MHKQDGDVEGRFCRKSLKTMPTRAAPHIQRAPDYSYLILLKNRAHPPRKAAKAIVKEYSRWDHSF